MRDGLGLRTRLLTTRRPTVKPGIPEIKFVRIDG